MAVPHACVAFGTAELLEMNHATADFDHLLRSPEFNALLAAQAAAACGPSSLLRTSDGRIELGPNCVFLLAPVDEQADAPARTKFEMLPYGDESTSLAAEEANKTAPTAEVISKAEPVEQAGEEPMLLPLPRGSRRPVRARDAGRPPPRAITIRATALRLLPLENECVAGDTMRHTDSAIAEPWIDAADTQLRRAVTDPRNRDRSGRVRWKHIEDAARAGDARFTLLRLRIPKKHMKNNHKHLMRRWDWLCDNFPHCRAAEEEAVAAARTARAAAPARRRRAAVA